MIEKNIKQGVNAFEEYSCFMFNSSAEFVIIRNNKKQYYEVDKYFHALPFVVTRKGEVPHQKPASFDEVLKLASKLSEPFGFVRVDFMVCDNQIYFGELTFSPFAGKYNITPANYNDIYGEKLEKMPIIKSGFKYQE